MTRKTRSLDSSPRPIRVARDFFASPFVTRLRPGPAMRSLFFLLVGGLFCGCGAQSPGQQAQPIKTSTVSARRPEVATTPPPETSSARPPEKHDRKWVHEEVRVMISSDCGTCAAEATGNLRRFAGRDGAIPFLLEFLATGTERERVGAARRLGHNGVDPAVAVGPLTAALADRNDEVRVAVAKALGEFGEDAMPAVPVLRGKLADPNANVRVHAASALWKITHRYAELLPVLLESLKHTDEDVCLTAIQTVGEIGANAREAVPLLIALTRSKSLVFPTTSVEALGKIGPDAALAVPRLVQLLGHSDDAMRVFPAGALLDIQPDSEMATTVLVQELKGSSGYFWECAATVLGRHASAARGAIPLLRARLNDEDLGTRRTAAVTLWQMTQETDQVLPTLTGLLEPGVHWQSRIAAAEALGTIGPGAKAAVPKLMRALNDEDDGLRAAAATALGKVGRGSRDAIPSLVKRKNDEAFAVRQAATKALRLIDPGT